MKRKRRNYIFNDLICMAFQMVRQQGGRNFYISRHFNDGKIDLLIRLINKEFREIHNHIPHDGWKNKLYKRILDNIPLDSGFLLNENSPVFVKCVNCQKIFHVHDKEIGFPIDDSRFRRGSANVEIKNMICGPCIKIIEEKKEVRNRLLAKKWPSFYITDEIIEMEKIRLAIIRKLKNLKTEK